jgi:CrcB protein
MWPMHTGHWPAATFGVNLMGSFILGLLLEGLARHGLDQADHGWALRARLWAGTGFCGGLTTYSTLAVELDMFARGHQVRLALVYAVTSVALGIIAAAAGIWVASTVHFPESTEEEGR